MAFSRHSTLYIFFLSSRERFSLWDNNKRSFPSFTVYEISHRDEIDRDRRQKDATRIKRTEGGAPTARFNPGCWYFHPGPRKGRWSSLEWMDDLTRLKTSRRNVIKAVMANMSSRCINFMLRILKLESTQSFASLSIEVNSVNL